MDLQAVKVPQIKLPTLLDQDDRKLWGSALALAALALFTALILGLVVRVFLLAAFGTF